MDGHDIHWNVGTLTVYKHGNLRRASALILTWAEGGSRIVSIQVQANAHGRLIHILGCVLFCSYMARSALASKSPSDTLCFGSNLATPALTDNLYRGSSALAS
jgi:hypothetical protein